MVDAKTTFCAFVITATRPTPKICRFILLVGCKRARASCCEYLMLRLEIAQSNTWIRKPNRRNISLLRSVAVVDYREQDNGK
jgi:hypothetical protein